MNKAQKSRNSDQEAPAVTSASLDSVKDDADNLLEFAQQIASAKTGKFSALKSEAAGCPKAVKQSRATEKPVSLCRLSYV
jgi:hypothetical protein